MSKKSSTPFFKGLKESMSTYKPEILLATGLTGMLAASIFSSIAGSKSVKLIEEAEERKNKELEEYTPLTKMEVFKTVWKPYLPAVLAYATSAACLICSRNVQAKRTAVIATAYKISEKALETYREKVIETIGEKKEKEVRDKVAAKAVTENSQSAAPIIISKKGETLCLDMISGRYFKSDYDSIKKAENELNFRLNREMYISLNEFYYELGLPTNKLGNELGWNIDDGVVDLHLSSQLTESGEPCLVVDYHIAPRYDYNKLL